MTVSDRAVEIARAITAYEEAEAAMDPAKRQRLSEMLKTLHDLSESIDGRRHSKPLMDALRSVDLGSGNELEDLITDLRDGLMRLQARQAEMEDLGYQVAVRAR